MSSLLSTLPCISIVTAILRYFTAGFGERKLKGVDWITLPWHEHRCTAVKLITQYKDISVSFLARFRRGNSPCFPWAFISLQNPSVARPVVIKIKVRKMSNCIWIQLRASNNIFQDIMSIEHNDVMYVHKFAQIFI